MILSLILTVTVTVTVIVTLTLTLTLLSSQIGSAAFDYLRQEDFLQVRTLWGYAAWGHAAWGYAAHGSGDLMGAYCLGACGLCQVVMLWGDVVYVSGDVVGGCGLCQW